MDSSEIAKVFEDIRALSCDGAGVTRASYGSGEQRAIEHLIAVANRHSLSHSVDRAGNIVFRLPIGSSAEGASRQQQRLLVGSHADSVAQAGNYDGLAGVVAGLVCLARLRTEHPTSPLEVVCFRGEESAWFGKACKGSSALLGKLGPKDLDLVDASSRRTLRESLAGVSADVAAIERQEMLLDPHSIAAYLELHIEQGPVLVDKALPVGLVTGIRGNVRHVCVRLQGHAGHAGTVPPELRRDAVFAAAELLFRTEALWQALLAQGHDLVVTCGVLGTQPPAHAMTRIPDDVRFTFEARSLHVSTLDRMHADFAALCDAVSARRSVTITLDRRIDTAPAVMSPALTQYLEHIAQQQNIPCVRLPSGAGHDAAIFAACGIPTGMVFVRNEHGSHNPAEAMDLDDFHLATELLYQAVLQLSRSPAEFRSLDAV